MKLLAISDEEGTALRKRRILSRRMYMNCGPNFSWHADGYDKLKLFGVVIHGCIDGFSCKIIWLEASSSNNNPATICSINKVQSLGGMMQAIRV